MQRPGGVSLSDSLLSYFWPLTYHMFAFWCNRQAEIYPHMVEKNIILTIMRILYGEYRR